MATERFKLIIGNKNLSSWSLRPWLVMQHFDIPFTEQLVRLDRPEERGALSEISPSGLVPCLIDDGFAVWDSLAICEYLADIHPEKNIWPEDQSARARARSLANEMHSGFQNLRTVWPMEFTRSDLNVVQGFPIQGDIARVLKLWEEARTDFGVKATGEAAGPFLFGAFSIADAMFAPVVSRFKTYGPVEMSDMCKDYMSAVLSSAAMKLWGEGATAEL